MDKKKLFLVLGICLLLVGLVTAWWIVSYRSVTSFSIVGSSGNPIVIETDLSNHTFDLTTTSEILQTISITNNGDPVDVLVTKEVTFVADDPGCTDEDILFELSDYIGTYETGSTLHVNGMAHVLEVLTTAPHGVLSCAGSYLLEIELEEIIP